MNKTFSVIIISICCFAKFTVSSAQTDSMKNRILLDDVQHSEKIIGLQFNEAKNDSMLDAINDQLHNYQSIRKVELKNNIPPAILFNPIPNGFKFPKSKKVLKISSVKKIKSPNNIEEVAFYTIPQLAQLIKTKKISSLQLTKMYISRLKKYDSQLHCVITLTESLAVAQAKRADDELAKGKYRGLLHGIPYGAKDLLAQKDYKTTWGSVPFQEQVLHEDATVVKKLEEAGAVLCAKFSVGELAWGDVWFGGMTRNPWDTTQGSSGSSAGSASATSAGLVAFAIGTETWGSIVSPSTQCGVTGLRPTYGRVSRKGTMALSWSMDKIGPICRTAEDCAIVFNAIYGVDGEDQTLYDIPFSYTGNINFKKFRFGYIKNDFDSLKQNKNIADSTLSILKQLGATLIPVTLPKYPINDISIILTAEAGAAFDELTRNGGDDLMVRQIKDAWPNVFRASRFIPAVEYIQANRVRYIIIQEVQKIFDSIDVYVAPSFSDNLLLTNLTGHPCVVIPNGFTNDEHPTSISFTGKLFDEETILDIAKKFQDVTDFHLKHPKQFLP